MKRGGVVVRATVGLLLVYFGNLEAQRRVEPAGFFGMSLVAADAVGELGALIDNGFGLQLEGGAPMTADGLLRIRGDLGVIIYGHERQFFCYTLSCRVGSDLTTTNSIFYGGIGPELVFPLDGVEPYVHATAGLSYFLTSSSLDDHDGYGPYLRTTNYDDLVFAWKAGGGLRLRVGNGYRPVWLDFGVERHDNGVARFLTKGDIVDHADGSISVFPNRSEANLFTFRFGVSIGFPRGRDRDR
jgi:hypothetical protein